MNYPTNRQPAKMLAMLKLMPHRALLKCELSREMHTRREPKGIGI
jgi:hypothetical protein